MKLDDRKEKGHFFRENYRQLILITGLSVLLMVPRLLSAQYGLLDDGNTFRAGREMVEGTWGLDWKAGSGRFRPMYWIFNAVLTLLFPENAAGAFAINTLVLIGSGILLYWISLQLFDDKRPAIFGTVFYILSGPVIETFYTISKAEHFQVLCILLSIFWTIRAAGFDSTWKMFWSYSAALICISLALLTKETSIVMVPVAIGWVLTAVITKRWFPAARKITPKIIYSGMTIISAAGFGLAYYFIIGFSPSQDSYASKYAISFDRIVDSAVRLTGWLLRDFPHLLPWAVGVLVIFIWLKKTRDLPVVLDTLVWMLGWIGVFLPWGSTQEFYLLPFSTGTALFSGWLLSQLIFESRKLHGKKQVVIFILGVLGAPLFLITQLHNYTSARMQLIVDRENAKMIAYIVEQVPPEGRIYFNMPEGVEYSWEFRNQMRDVYKRPDLIIEPFRFQTAISEQARDLEYFVPSPHIESRIKLSVRIGVSESLNKSHDELTAFLNDTPPPVYSSRDSFRVFHFDVFKLFCPLFPQKNYCMIDRTVIDRRMFVYGWDIDKVFFHAADQARPGMYQDGAWKIVKTDGSIAEVMFGELGDLPLVADYNGDTYTDLGVLRLQESLLLYDLDFDGMEDGFIFFTEDLTEASIITGDWNGDGVDQVAIFHQDSQELYSLTGDLIQEISIPELNMDQINYPIPISGDWDGDGIDGMAVYDPDSGNLYFGSITLQVPEETTVFGADLTGYGKDTVVYFHDGTWRWLMVHMDCDICNLADPMVIEDLQGQPVFGKWIE